MTLYSENTQDTTEQLLLEVKRCFCVSLYW